MKKVTVILTIFVFVALGLFLGYKYTQKAPTNDNNIVADNNQNPADVPVVNVDNPTTHTEVEEPHVKDPTNVTIYVGMGDTFKEFKFSMEENLSVQQEANNIINEIGRIIGYKMLVNDISNGKDGMTINFNSSSAPFNTVDSYIGNEQYTIADYSNVVYTIFDSIDKTLKDYFGGQFDIWFTLEDGEITIDTIVPTLYLPFIEPYQGSNHYLETE